MKTLLLLVSTIFFMNEVSAQSAENIKTITFTKQSRGFLDEVIISRDSVRGFSENHRQPGQSQQYANQIDSDGWAKLMQALSEVSLNDIDGLKSPTVNRAHDGAIHSTIVITFEDGSTVSHSFDDENPHPDLQPLLAAILDHRMSNR